MTTQTKRPRGRPPLAPRNWYAKLICYKCERAKPQDEFSGWAEDRKVCLDNGCICDECRGTRPLDYDRRNRFLKVLGFMSYKHYLASDMWKTIRGMVLKLDDGRCVVCGGPAVNVHHNSYEIDVLIGKDLQQLMSLCRTHHEEAEFDELARKRELPEVRKSLEAKGLNVAPLVRGYISGRLVDRKSKITRCPKALIPDASKMNPAAAKYDPDQVAAQEEAARISNRRESEEKARTAWLASKAKEVASIPF